MLGPAHTFFSPDLTVSLNRYPRGEWVCLDGERAWRRAGVRSRSAGRVCGAELDRRSVSERTRGDLGRLAHAWNPLRETPRTRQSIAIG